MDPNQLAIVLGLLTNGLYSLILFTGNKVGKGLEDLAFREDNIQERLTKNKSIFASIIEGAFKDLPPVIKQDELCEFLGHDQTKDIVGRIYFFDGFSEANPYSLETIRVDFTSLLCQYFNDREEVSAFAPQLFSILIMCCQKSLETIITEEQDLSAIDAKLTLYFKHCIEVLNSYHDNLYREIKANQESLNELHIKFNEFDHKIKEGLNNLPQRIKLELQSGSFTPSFINMAPDLEDGFIQRDAEYNQLVEGLLNSQSDVAVAITSALRGAGGYGKTTLAKAVCHDPKIIERYSDGILWATLGENPRNVIGHIQDLIYRLSDKRPEFEGLEAAISYFKEFLKGKRLLLVIDDVWDSSHLEPFMQGGVDCSRLITTRINDVLPEGTLEVRVDTMKKKEAGKLLLSGISCTLSWSEDQKINKLAKRLGYWPLLLKMVNSALIQYVERGKSFEEALDHVNHKLDRKNLTAFDPKTPQKRNQAVEATISISFDLLDEDEFERYKELAIFPEDEEVNLKTVEKLWGRTAGYDEFDVEDLCYKLFDLSLLQAYDDYKKIIKLHDVMRDYLNDKNQQKIHLTHSMFLEAHEVRTWTDLPKEETYLWKNLSHHLVGAGRREELRKLLLNFDWIQCKLNATDVHFLVNDYDFFPEDCPVEMVKGAIQLSANALFKDKKLLKGQLLGRLELFSEIEIKSMLEYIRSHTNGMRILPLTGSLIPPGGPLIRTLEGHSFVVNAVSITPDGDSAVSASSDGTLKVWSLKTGKEVYTLIHCKNANYTGGVNAVTITPDGNYAISASDDTLKVWNLKTGKGVHTLTGHRINNFGGVRAVSVTPDGNYVVSASADKTLKVWNLKTGKEIYTLKGHFNEVNTVSITPNGNYVVSASDDSTLNVWDLKTGNKVRTLTGHSGSVNSVSITPDGSYAVSTSRDMTLKVWDLKTGNEVRTLIGHSGYVNAVSVASDGNYAVSGSSDCTLKVWNLKTGEEVHTLKGHSEDITSVSITPDGNYVVSASRDSTLKMWDLKTGSEVLALIGGHSSGIRGFSISSDGNYAVSASGDSTLKVWDLKIRNQIHTLPGHSDIVRAISITPDGNYAVSASHDNTLKVWSLKTGNEIHTLTGHSDMVRGVSITPNGNYAVSASRDCTLKVWSLKTGEEVHTLRGHYIGNYAVSVTPDGNYAVSGSGDSTLKVWDLKTGEEVHTLTGHFGAVIAVSITPDGNYAVSASDDDSKLIVWNLKTGKAVHALIGHSEGIISILITPDGNYVVSASADYTVRVWNLKTGKEVHTLVGHSGVVRAVSITPDGNYAVSASRDNTLKVWSLKTGKEIHTLIGHSNWVNAISITPDGNYAVSASEDRTLKVWNLKTGEEVASFGGDNALECITFSPDGNIIVAGEDSGRVHFLVFESENYGKTYPHF